MDIAAKLQIKPGQLLATIAGPGDVPPIEGPDRASNPGDADAIIAFVRNSEELDAVATAAVEAAKTGKLAWIAYPKAGQLGTDLNRDILARQLANRDIQPVRQVSIDGTWSALRFRPA